MHLLLSATVAIAALNTSVIGVPTPLDTRTNAVALDGIDCSPSEGICRTWNAGEENSCEDQIEENLATYVGGGPPPVEPLN